MKEDKKVGLVGVLSAIKSGFSPAQISKKHNIPKQNISYFVGKLKQMGCIEKIGYGTWRYIRPLKQVKDLTTTHSTRSNEKEIRGHAYIWKIQFLRPYDWARAVKRCQKKTLTFELMKHNKILRTIFKSRKVWLGKKGLTIYEPMDFMGKSSFEVKGNAVFEMDLLIKDLLKELGLKFRPYRFTTSREHYGIIKNELARQYNDKKQKMLIRSEDGSIWMWIDDSKGLGELENCDPTLNRQVQNFWNNHKEHDFKIDADFVLKGMAKQTENLDHYAKHLKSHVASVQVLGSEVEKFGTSVKTQNKIQTKTLAVLEMMEKRMEKLEGQK